MFVLRIIFLVIWLGYFGAMNCRLLYDALSDDDPKWIFAVYCCIAPLMGPLGTAFFCRA